MIALHMNRPDYENDIRALLMSFFFGEKIVTDRQILKLHEPERIFSQEFTVEYNEKGAVLKVSGGTVENAGDETGENDDTGAFSKKNETEKNPYMKKNCIFDGSRKDRDALKDAVYELLSDYTGLSLPWGTLTGVRPTKIPMEIMEHDGDEEEASMYMKEYYRVSDEKAHLASQVAKTESRIIGKLYGIFSPKFNLSDGVPCPGFSLYVGIPFCPSICAYCSFSSFPIREWEGRVDDYISALEREIRAMGNVMREPLTFYMGGGTPTSVSASQLDRVLSCIDENFDMSGCLEKTIEAGRPDSITPDKLKVMRAHGIDRISINPQTMNQGTLDLIGRRHSTDDVLRAFSIAREEGFDNINMDIIIGLPGETSMQMRRTMDEICRLEPESITVHSLALKRAAFLNQNREKFPVAGPEEVARMSRISRDGALSLGLKPYYLYRQKNIAGNLENTGYSLPGKECLYNIIIMEEFQNILALGGGSVSKRIYPGHRIERCANVKSVNDYINRTDEMIDRKMALFMENSL